MAALIFKDQPRAVTLDGALLPGASLGLYTTGTLNKSHAFADGDLRTLLLDPLIAGAAARFPALWLDPDVTYRAILTSAEGVEAWDLDPLTVFPGTDEGTPVDDDGSPLPFATLTFWRAGTTQLQDVFEDAGLTTPLDNPVVADVDGVFPTIYVDDEQEYRYKLQRQDGTLIHDIDPYLFVADALPNFETALRSTLINGSAFTAPASWAFGSSNFSCEDWVRPNGALDGEVGRMLRARPQGGAQSGWEFCLRRGVGDNKFLRLTLRPVGTSTNFDSPQFTLADGTYAHVAVTVDRTGNLARFYLNGAPLGSVSIASVVGALGFSGAFRILDSINADLDELRVWTVKRSDAEIAANYAAPLANPLAEPNLIAYFQFNEGSGTTTEDVIGEELCTLASGCSFVAGPP